MGNSQHKNANFPVLSSFIFMDPRAVLADACSLAYTGPTAPHQKKKYTDTGNITEIELFGALGQSSCNSAEAEGHLFLKTTMARHSDAKLSSFDCLTSVMVCICV